MAATTRKAGYSPHWAPWLNPTRLSKVRISRSAANPAMFTNGSGESVHGFVESVADDARGEATRVSARSATKLVKPFRRPRWVVGPFGVPVVEEVHVPCRTGAFPDDSVRECIARKSRTPGVEVMNDARVGDGGGHLRGRVQAVSG